MVDGTFGYPATVLTTFETRAQLPTTIKPEDIYIFRAEISNGNLDSYFTRMHESSLRNYAEDALVGIALQNSHRHNELPFGKSLYGAYDDGRTFADFYTIRDLNLNGVNTDDLIRGIEAGIVQKVSIGFFGGTFECSVCGHDLWSKDCTHVPGLRYENNIAYAWVRDAHLAETSVVYEGATPGAAILKAQQEAEAGRLRPDAAAIIEARYRIKLPAAQRIWTPGKDLKVELEARLREVLAVEEEADVFERVVEIHNDRETIAAAFANAQTAAREASERMASLQAQVAELQPLAADGRAYRSDLIGEALAEGVRAMGSDFASDTYRSILEAAPIEAVKRMRDDWRSVADKALAGGRMTEDKAERKPAKVEKTIPNAAFIG